MVKKKQINQKVIVKQDTNWFFQYSPYFIIILFSVFLAIGMSYHEMWRDELEAYGRNAFLNGFKISVAVYEFFVYINLMKLFLWVNNSLIMFQFYHFAIIVTAIFLLNKYSPFTLFEKFFITFSYFLFFEYGTISRYYGFLILMVFLIMFLLSRKKVNYYLIIIPLIILANHSINSFIFALPIFLIVINNFFKNFKKIAITRNIAISIILVIICFLVFGAYFFSHTLKQKIQFEPLGDAPYFMTIRAIWNSFVPLPKFTNHAIFWNTNFFTFPTAYPSSLDVNILRNPQNIILSILSVLIFLVILIKFSKKPIVFWIFLSNYIILLVFLQIAKIYFIRHQGLLFIAFLYSYWLFYIAEEEIYIPVLNKIKLNVLSKINIDPVFKPMIMIFLVL
jgi:hypothetical protein